MKFAWAEAKRAAARAIETKKFYEDVCSKVIESGEKAVREARREWEKESRVSLEKAFDEDEAKGYAEQELYAARAISWEVAIANFKPYRRPTISTEIVDSRLLAEIQALA